MPSQQLKQISDQIEANGTDDFSKFYMYAGLLNLLAVREQNMNFFSVQPETAPLIRSAKKLQLGDFTGEFNRQVNAYKAEFDTPVPDQLLVIQKIIMAYARKGQLADLVFIVDKMVDHLSVSNLKPINEHNGGIYDSINFEKKRAAVYEFINGVSALNHQLLSALDGSVNSTISAGVAVAGLVVILGSVFSLVGLLIGGAMLTGGAYCSYSYAPLESPHFFSFSRSAQKSCWIRMS